MLSYCDEHRAISLQELQRANTSARSKLMEPNQHPANRLNSKTKDVEFKLGGLIYERNNLKTI